MARSISASPPATAPHLGRHARRSRSLRIRWAIVGLTAGIAVLDALTVRGSAEGNLYVLPVLLAYFSRSQRVALATSVAVSLLNVLEFVVSALPPGVPTAVFVLNRAYAVVAIWATYGAVFLAWRANRARWASERHLGLLVDAVKGYAIYELDLAGTIMTWNAGAERLMGYLRDEIVGVNYADLFPSEARAAGHPPQELVHALTHSSVEVEGWRVRKDGSRFWANGTLTTLYNAHGQAEGFAKVTRDLTERRAGEALFRSVFDHADEGIISSDEAGTIELFNHAAERTFGYLASEAIGQNLRILMPEPDRGQHHTYLANYVCTGRAEMLGIHREVVACRKDGSTFPAEITISEFFVDERRHFMGIVHDLTTSKRLEAQIRQQQKMEAIGQLAGGVAHDFNNLLTVISGNTEIALERLSERDPVRENVEEIERATTRAADLTRQLLAFARNRVLVPKVLDLNAVVGEMWKMLTRLIREDITLDAMLAPDLWKVRADVGQIEQVITNLVVNARDAMPQGGRLIIETQNVELDATYARQHPGAQPGSHVRLAVSDTGSGMDEETMGRLFQPFFTTKPPGRGTGLGLATVYGAVRQSDGYIWVDSTLGKGTVFTIHFPRANAPLDRTVDREVRAPAYGTETILLVEDEAGVRRLARRALEDKGYTVLEAADGQQALDLAKHHAGSLHLLVTDVVMPRLGGHAVAEQITPLRPGLKVLYLSGYTTDVTVHQGILDVGTPVLEKPFTPSVLAAKVRAVLDCAG